MRAELYWCTATAMNMAIFLGVFVDCCLFACCPGGHWGNTERVVARWRLPAGASSVALDLLHPAMPCSSLQWPSKWPAMEAHSFVIVDFIINHNRG
jgi:hypothetical protein